MASEFQDYTYVIDKIPDGGILKLRVHVQYSWIFKLRFWVGVRLARMAAWFLNMEIRVEREEG